MTRPPLTPAQRERRNDLRRARYAAQPPEWHEAERTRKRLSARREREQHPETFAAASHRWWESRGKYDEELLRRKREFLSERNADYCRRRRALKSGADSDPFTVGIVLEVWGTDCHICGNPIDLGAPRRSGDPGWELGLHLDHVVPLSRGGTDTLENVRPSHGRCNLCKSNN